MQNRTDKSLFGIDINEYSQGVDFSVLATTIDFLYLRSSGSASGRFRVDKKFLEFAGKARNFKIPVGAYHFGVPSYDLTTADSQCDDFINIIQDIKLQNACALLKNPDISINKIIDSVGYSNSTHFYKIFKKSYGVTPIDYRNNNINFN